MRYKTIEVNDTLHLHVHNSNDPHCQIDRVDGGLVRLEWAELERLADMLTALVQLVEPFEEKANEDEQHPAV